MIIKINYNKSTGAITLTDDEELMEATVNETVDTTEELSFEISLNNFTRKLKKSLKDKLGGMTRDEIRKYVGDLTAGIDFGDVSDEQYVESVIWAILHPEEAKGDAPKSALSGPRPGEKSEF